MACRRVALHRILCPTDFSELSRLALQRAVALARWFEARVTVFHALPRSLPVALMGSDGSHAAAPKHRLRAERQTAANELLLEIEPLLSEGVPIETRVADGDPTLAIQLLAEALPADLLVMGTHGRSGFEHLILGSITERLLRTAPCPVLAMRNTRPIPPGRPFRKILCAADLTPASESALDMAAALGGESVASVTLMHVVEGLLGESGPDLYRPIPESSSLRRILVDDATERLQLAGRRVRNLCDLSERVETGSAWRAILRVAEETDADLIVLGAHAPGVVGRFFFGSTANQVVRHAPCPVLVVRKLRAAVRSEAEERGSLAAVGCGA